MELIQLELLLDAYGMSLMYDFWTLYGLECGWGYVVSVASFMVSDYYERVKWKAGVKWRGIVLSVASQ
jgi:hypothetical protein